MPNLGRVSGKKTVDGEPISAMARIVFQPENGPTCLAETDENGNDEIIFDAGTPAAVIGENTVSISTERFDVDEQGNRVIHQETIPEKYNVASTLTFEVTPEAQTKDWELTTK